MPKLTFEFLQKEFNNRGFVLLEQEYKNNKQKLEYVCPDGHVGSISWNSFSKGHGCSICFGNDKPTIDEVRVTFEAAGFKLLSTKYINSSSPLFFECPNGHKHNIAWSSFKHGQRCGVCAGKHYDLEYCKRVFSECGYEVLTKEYKGSFSKLKVRCPKGHLSYIHLTHFKSGVRCAACSGKKPKTKIDLIDYIEDIGYTVSSDIEYVNNKSKFDVVCSSGHMFSTCWNKISNGRRCPICWSNSTSSKPEKELYHYIRGLLKHKRIYCNTRKIIPPKELDIYIPSKKLAIEYCGLYWHSEISGGKSKKYHREKYDMCKSKGIRLITVFEDEYLERPEVVRSRIQNTLGIFEERVYARKTKFVEITKQEAQEFFYCNHLQGYSPCRYRFGLIYNGVLVQAMTFGRVSRAHASSKGVWEMKRLASLPGFSVVGGPSKLFSNSLKSMLEAGLEVEAVKSYCDLRWSSNTPVYEHLGFNEVRETKYTPHYLKSGVRYRNQSLAKTKAEKKTGLTEWELRRKQGYDRIWDCGHSTYVYEVK